MEHVDFHHANLETSLGCSHHSEKIHVGKRIGRKPLGSPAGKDSWLPLLLDSIPTHKTYVEPYAGSASLFFAKEPSQKEIIADKNMGFISVYKFLRDASDADFDWLRGQEWRGSQSRFASLSASKPRNLRERAYRFKYLNLYSRRRECSLYAILPGDRRTGKEFLANLERWRERLAGVEILYKDALQVMLQYDSKDTFHYIDPPWKKITGMLGGETFDASAFTSAVSTLKGSALISYQGDLELGDRWRMKEHAPNTASFSDKSKQRLYINYAVSKNLVRNEDTKFLELSKEELTKAAKIQKEFIRRNKATARPLKRAIFRFFKKIVRREVNKLQRNGTLRLFSNKAGVRKIQKNLDQLVIVHKSKEDDEELSKLIRTYGVRVYERAGNRTSKELGGTWETRPAELDEIIREKEIKIVETMNHIREELQDTIRDVLVESSQMEPRPGIGDITRQIYSRTLDSGKVNPARAERIARTETASYENSGIMKGYKVSGITRIRWISIMDSRVRREGTDLKWNRQPANHAVMNRLETDIGVPFINPVTQAELRYPGDPRGAPQEIINCRCTTMPVTKR